MTWLRHLIARGLEPFADVGEAAAALLGDGAGDHRLGLSHQSADMLDQLLGSFGGGGVVTVFHEWNFRWLD